jgi:hypothetical protein
MTDLDKLSKTELAAIIGGLTATQIKKASHRELMNRAAHAQGKLTEMNAFGDDPDTPPAPAPKADKPKAAKARKAKAAPAPRTTRKPGADVILFLPADAQKEPRAGSKRAAIIDLLRGPTGTTVDDIAAATGWARSVAQSALHVDVKGSGFGVERKDGRLFLLPQEVK